MMDAGSAERGKTCVENTGIPTSTAAQAIGYKEFFPYFAGDELRLPPCVEKLKQASRNYAKRQLTWFRHMDGVLLAGRLGAGRHGPGPSCLTQ